MVQELETRWNSTFFMLLRIYEERKAVDAALTSLNRKIIPLNSKKFEAILQCLHALLAFNYTPVELSAEKIVTPSKLIPIVRMLFHKINEKTHHLTSQTAIDLTNNLMANLKHCFGGTESIRMLAKATFLIPDLRLLKLQSSIA